MKREVSLGSEHGSLNDRHDASDGGTLSPQSLRLDRGGSSVEGNEKPALSSLKKDEAWYVDGKQEGVAGEDATQLAEPVDRDGVETVRYVRLQRKLQAMAAAPTVKSQGQSLGSASPSPFGSSLADHSPHSPAQGTAGDNSDHHGPETNSESSNPVQAFPTTSILVASLRPAPLAYDLCDITEEDHSAQLSQSSRLLGQQHVNQENYNSATNYQTKDSGNILLLQDRSQSSIEHPDNQRLVLFDKSQSSQMHGLNMNGDIPTRNANMAQRHSSNSQQKGETDSSILMDKSFPSSDQQIQITKFANTYGNAPHSLNNYHSTFPYSAQRSSLHSTPVVATPGGGAQFGVQSQVKGASPSVEDFEKASPVLGATHFTSPHYQNEMFRSSFRSPNPFNAHTDYNRVFPTEQRHTYGSGGNSLEYSRLMTGGSVGPDEDVIQPSKSVNSAQFYDLLKEHRNFMSSQQQEQQEVAEGFAHLSNRHMSQKVLKQNMSLKKAKAGSGTMPFGGAREASSSMRRSVQVPNNTHPDARPQSDEDLLSHMSRLSQLVPNHDQLENAAVLSNNNSQRGSQASRNATLKAPTQQQMLKHFQLMEQKLNVLQNQMQVRDKEVEDLKSQNERLNTKLATESTNVKVLQSQRDLKAGSGRLPGRNGIKSSQTTLQSGKSSVQLNQNPMTQNSEKWRSEKNQMIDDFDSAFSGSNRHGSKSGTGKLQTSTTSTVQALSKHALGAALGQNQQWAVVHQKDELAQSSPIQLITEGSESSTNKMEFQADEYDQEDEILAIKKELSSHKSQTILSNTSNTHPSIASPPDRSPNRSPINQSPTLSKYQVSEGQIIEGRPSTTDKAGIMSQDSSICSNNQSTRLFTLHISHPSFGDGEKHSQQRSLQMDAHQTVAGPIIGQRKDLEQNGMTADQPEWAASNAQKNGKAAQQKEEDAADPREIQDGSLASSHKMNETAEPGSRGGDQLHAVALKLQSLNQILYTSVTHNQSDSSFEKDFGELRAGHQSNLLNLGQGLLEGKDGYNPELSNQAEARAKTPPLVPELFSINSSIEKKDKKDVRLDQDDGFEQEGEQPKDKNDEMFRQQLFGKQNTIARMSPVGSGRKTLRKQWQIKNKEEQRAGASKDSGGEDDQNHAVFQYDPEQLFPEVASTRNKSKRQSISQSVGSMTLQIPKIDQRVAAHNNSISTDKPTKHIPFEMHAFDGDDHPDKEEAEKKADAKSNGQPPRIQYTIKSPENKEFTLSDIRPVAACSPAPGPQKFSFSVPTSHQATAEKQNPSRNACNISHTSSLGSRPKREGKRAAQGPFGAKDRSKATKSQRRLKQSSVGTYSEGKNAEAGQSAQNETNLNNSRSQGKISGEARDNSDAEQSFVDQSNHGKTNAVPERVRQLQQKAASMKSQIQNHEKENFALREKIANLKKLYHKKQDQVQDLELQHEQSLRKQDELKEALEERQNIIDSHQVEIEELKKQNLQGTRSQFSQIDIKNKETQIYVREFTKDHGCQVDIDIQPPQNQLPYTPQLMNGHMPPMIHPYLYASMAAPPLSNPTPEPLSANFTPVTDVIDKMIMRDSFDLNRELNPNKDANSQMENTNDPRSIGALVKQCKKYEAAQQKLQTEIHQDQQQEQQQQQQMAQLAMHQSMMTMSLPSNYQSLYPNRAAEQLDIKTDQNILLEKANTQLQGKLMQQKEKYVHMKQQFQKQLQEQDAFNSGLPGQRGNKRTPQMTSQKKTNGYKSKQSWSPSAVRIQNFDHFNSLISNQLAKYQSSQSQTDPQMNTAEPHIQSYRLHRDNQLQMQGNAGSPDEASSQYLQGNMNTQYRQMLGRQSLQPQPDGTNGRIKSDTFSPPTVLTNRVAQQSSEYGELADQEESNHGTAQEGIKGGADDSLLDSRKQSFNQKLQMFDERQQYQRHNKQSFNQHKRSMQHSSHYDVYSGQFYQQNSATQDLEALDAPYADVEHGGYDSEGVIAHPDQQLPAFINYSGTEDTPVVKYSQDGSKMSGPMKHPVTISKWLIPANGQTMNSHNVNSAGYATDAEQKYMWLQQSQSAVAAAYMQELPQNSQSQVKATASAFDLREPSQQQSELEQSNEQIRPERVTYYRREAQQSAAEKVKGKRGLYERKRSRNARTTRNGSMIEIKRNKSWSNQNAGPIKIDVRKQHNSGSKPRVTRIIPATSSPAKTAQSRRDQRSGLAESSVQQQTYNAGKKKSPAHRVLSYADQDALDAGEDKNIPQNQVSCTFHSQRQHTEESEVLAKPKDQDIALRVHAKRRQRLNGSKKQQLTKSFSPEKQAVGHKRATGEVYQPSLKESACAWYIPSLQKAVPQGTSKRRTGKTQTKNNKRPRESHVLSFGQEEEFNATKKVVESRNNVEPVPKAQDEDEQYQSLNLDIRTSDRNDVRNGYNTNEIQQNSSSPDGAVEVLVQDQAVPQPDGLSSFRASSPPPVDNLQSIFNQDHAQISNGTRELLHKYNNQVQAEENTFQLSSTISPGATQAQQTITSSLRLAEVTRPVGSHSSTAEAIALKQLAQSQKIEQHLKIQTEESNKSPISRRSEYPSARHLDPMVAAHPTAQVSDAQLDSEFDQIKRKEHQQQRRQQEEKKAMKAAHLKNIMAQLQRLKDQQASVDQLSQEELKLVSFRTSQNQRQKLDEIRRKYSAPI